MKAKLLFAVFVMTGLLITASKSYGCFNQSPTADVNAVPQEVLVGESVTLEGSGSFDPDGESGINGIMKFEWDFTNNGSYDYYETSSYHPDGAFDGNTTHTYDSNGTYTVKLRVRDNGGPYGYAYDTDTCTVNVFRVKNANTSSFYDTIQSALNYANDGDFIEIGRGTHYETIDFDGVSCTIRSADVNDWTVVSTTIINVDGAAHAVTFNSGEDANSVLEGLTITGGQIGIYLNGTSPTIRNCIIKQNGTVNGLGGGMYDCNSSPTIENCFFVENDANAGGGIYDLNSSPEIINCVFARNDANYGGGIYSYNSLPQLTNCTFVQNYALVKGGGMYCEGNLSEPNVTNCIFWDNYADVDNDEICITSSADPNFSYCNLKDSGGSSNWDSDFGANDGDNIDKNPLFSAAIPTQGMVAFWNFDEGYETTAYDYIADNDGNVIDANWTTGQIEGALDFDGNGDYVLVADNSSLSPKKITLAAWIYPDDVSHDFQIIGKWGGGVNEYILDNKGNNDALRFAANFGGVWDVANSNDAVLTAGTWQHVVVTWDGSTAVFYVNGVNAGEDNSCSGDLPDSDNDVYIGSKYDGSRPFDGKIDNVRIYNRALLAGEVGQLYEYGLLGHYNYHTASNSPCVNAGDPNGNYEGQVDIDGYIRVQGGQVDVGAYEYASVYNSGGDEYFFTIQSAIDSADNNNVIILYPGTYYETIDFNNISCTLRGSDPNDPNVVAATIIDGNNAPVVVSLINGAHPKIKGLTITGGTIGIQCGAVSPTVSQCIISNNDGAGITCGDGADPNIIDSAIYGSRDGIVCYPNSAPTITFSDIYDNSDNGIMSIMATPTISNNILYNNSNGVTYIGYTAESIVNNAIVDNTCFGITSLGCQDPVINNCILWGNGDGLHDCNATYSCIEDDDSGTGNVSGFPYFANADNNDFHLLSYSPCIDVGDPNSSYSNEPNGGGGRINIGAYGNTSEATLISANTDGDNLPDDWENAYLGGLSQGDSNDNTDSDDANNIIEYRLGTRPDLSDTDGDGMSDGWEINNGLDPLDPSDAAGDLDGDEKTNLQEYQSGSDPNASNIINVPNDYSTIQAAIDSNTYNWDIIEIEPNTYSGDGNCDLDFGGKKITVRGKDPNDPPVIDCNGTQTDPNRGFYFHSGEGSDSIISDLIIINGYGQQVDSEYVGGAIYCKDSSPTIRNCEFSNNFANKGGAVYDSNCSPTIISCLFIENDANSGGAIYNEDSNTVLTNCIFNDNWAIDSNGGAIYNDANSAPILTNCTLASNLAENGDGGGIYNEPNSSPVLTNCILWGNIDGGDIYFSEDFDSGDCSDANFGDPCYTDWTVVDEGTTGSSSWSVDSGILKQGSDVYDSTEPNKHGTFVWYEQGSSWTDYRVNMEIESASTEDDAIGVMFRYQDANNYYRFSWDKEREYRRLVKCVNGVFTILAEDEVAYTSDQIYELEIIADGNELEISIDDELVLSATDSSLSSGSIALYCWENSNAEFDNIVVSNPSRSGEWEYAQIYGGSPDVMYSCIQDNNPDDTYIPFGGLTNGNIDDDPEFTNWLPGLVAHWRLDENATNKVVDNAEGTASRDGTATVNTSTLSTTGKRYNAFDFDGQYTVEVDDHAALSFGNGTADSPFSIAAWIYVTGPSSFQTILSKYDNTTGSVLREWLFYLDGSNKLSFSLYDNDTGGRAGQATDDALTTGWHFVVMTYNGAGAALADEGIILYVDNVAVDISGWNVGGYDSMVNTATTVKIGAAEGTAGTLTYFFQDKIDNVVLVNKALSQAKVEELYVYGSQLSFNSPCIDTGDDNAIRADISEDTIGNNRFLDGDDDEIVTIDMGAYEFDYDAWWSWGRAAYWKLDENTGTVAEDSAGDSNGTIQGATWTAGKSSSALSFNGTNDYIDCGNDSNLALTDNFSICGWIKPDSFASLAGIVSKYHTAGADSYTLRLNGTSPYNKVEFGGASTITGSSTLTTGQWYHIAAVMGAGTAKLYIDGRLDASGQITIDSSSDSVKVGVDYTTSPRYFDGVIDEVMIYDRALTPGEVAVLSGNRPPVLDEIGNQTVVIDDLLTFTLTSTDPDGDTITYSCPNLPSGAQLDDDIFSWMPQAGEDANYSVTFVANDGLTTDSETITIEVITEQLAAYWNFDETSSMIAHDSAGDNDGTVIGMRWWTDGKVGNGLYFDGTNDSVVISQNNIGISGDNDRTLCCWVKTDEEEDQAIVGLGNDDYGKAFYIKIGSDNDDDGKIDFYGGSSSKNIEDIDCYIADNTWHFVAASYNGTTTKIYVDDTEIASKSMTLNTRDLEISIGGMRSEDWWENYEYLYEFKGSIDEVLVFDRALDNNELNDIYQNGVNDVNALTGFVEPNYPISYWDFDEGGRDTAHDSVGDNDCTFNNPPWTIGKVDGALIFDNDGDYIEVPDQDYWTFDANFTILVWAKLDSYGINAFNPFVAHDEGAGEYNKWIFSYCPSHDGTEFHINSPSISAQNIVGNSWTPQAGVWYHLAVSRSGDTYTFYKQGVFDGNEINSTSIPNASNPLTIGWSENSDELDGTLDEVMIFDRALDTNEVNDIYQNALNGVSGLTGIEEANYPISYWKLDETGGPKAYDSVGNNHGDLKDDLHVVGWDRGVVEGALSLSGNADYVAIEDMNGAYYSIGFWAKFTGSNPDERIIDFGSGTYELIIKRDGTSSRLSYKNGSTAIVSDDGLIINGEWHHYAVVQIIDGQGNRVIFYRDGLQYGKTKTSTETPTADTRTACYIGSAGTTNYFTGLLDELRIYERSLTEVEVEQLANNLYHPVLTTIGNRSVDVNSLLTFTVHANDIDGDVLTYSASGLPAGTVFNNNTFSWIPYEGQQNTYEVTFTVNDGEFDDSETITITVNNFSSAPAGVAKAVSGQMGNDLSLQVDPFTGGVRYSVPIVVPPGRQGSEPSIALNYSGGGNGWCGFGWSLGMGVIQRNTRYGVPVARDANGYLDYYDDDKGLVVSFGPINSRLVLVDDSNNIYRAETDQAFLKYTFDKTNDQWIVTDKSGNNFYFGEVEGESPSEIVGICMDHPDFNDADSNDTFLWALAKILDKNGNTTYLEYATDSEQIYLDKISYNGNINNDPNPAVTATHTVDFVLEDRLDTSISFATGFAVETDKRLSEIIVEVNDVLVRRYDLVYKSSPSSKRSLLSSITVFGSDDTSTLPPLVFEYQTNPFEFGDIQDWGPIDSQGNTANDATGKKWNSPSATDSKDVIAELLDINGDGLPDRVMRNSSSPYDIFEVQLNTGVGFETDENGNYVTREWGPVKAQGNETDPEWGSIQAIDDNYDAKVMLLDINGDGLPDRVMRHDVAGFGDPNNLFKVQLNTGFGFEASIRSYTDVNSQGNSDTGWNSPHGSDGTNGENTHVTMLDINGDGLPDRVMRNDATNFEEPNNIYKVQLNNGDGTFDDVMDWGPLDAQGYTANDASGKKWNSPNAKSNSTDNDNIVSLLDLNGDGLPDRVMRKKDPNYTVFKVQFNTGYGFEADANGDPITTDWGPVYTQGHDTATDWGSIQAIDAGNAHVMLFDVSGDGLPDRVMRNDVTDFNYPENVFKVQINTGTGFEDGTRNWKNIENQEQDLTAAWNSPYASDADGALVIIIDIDGDGLPDRVMRHKTSSNFAAPHNVFKVQLNKGPAPDLLKKVTSRLGGSVEVTYTPSTAYDNTDDTGRNLLPFPIQTASSVTAKDGLGTESTTTYQYSRGYFDTDKREFRGFGKVEVTDPCGTKSITYFHQGGGYDNSEKGEYQDEGSIAKKGVPYCVELYGSDGLLYSRIINKVEEVEVDPNTGWYFPYTSQTIKMDYEGLDNYRAKASQSEYDPNTGNLLKSSGFGEVEDVNIADHSFTDIAGDSLYIHTTYETFNDPNILNKVKSTKTTSDSDGSTRLTQVIFTYDPNLGRVLKKETWLDVNDSNTVVEYGYGQYGNKIQIIDEVNIVTTIEYDSTYRMFPIKKTTGTFVTQTTYDVNSGLPVTSKGVMGIVAKNVYDQFYRLTDTYVSREPNGEPNLWLTNVEYNLGGIKDSNTSYNFIRQRFNGYEAFTYSDGLGRIIQSRTKAEDSAPYEYRIADNSYDVRGKTSFVTTAFFSDGYDFTLWDSNQPGVLSEYDSVGRVYRVTPSADDEDSPMGPATTAYTDGNDPWSQVSTDPLGKVKKWYYDAQGQIIKLVEVISDGNDCEVEYTYDILGRLTDTNDPAGNVIKASYDNFGRKTDTNDPDMGYWTYKYDDASRLTEQTDSRGNTIKLAYEPNAPGRLKEKKVYDSLDALVDTITYTYDDSNDANYTVYKGLLYKVEDGEGWIKTSYDSRGRAIKTTRYITETATSYTTETSYDDAGRVTNIIYPNNVAEIKYEYGSTGELVRVKSLSGTGVGANEIFYEPKSYNDTGQITEVRYGNGTRTEYDYYTYSKRLKRIHTYKSTTELMDSTYTFDKASNIKSINDSVFDSSASSSLSSIQYDDLYRLTSLYSVAEGNTVTYTYDALGNILTNGEYGTNTYLYQGSGHAHSQPHAVTSANGKSYSYDECGNMTTRGSQTLTYDEQNRLIDVNDPSASLDVGFGYAHGGSRLYKKNNNTNTVTQVWIGGIYEEKYDAVRDATLILCHVYAGGDLVATFEPEGYGRWAALIRKIPFGPQFCDIAGKTYVGLFRGGRAPFSFVSLAMLTGLAFGLYYTRRRLWVKYGLTSSGKSAVFYMRNPWRQMILLMLMASVIVATHPQDAFADAPTYDPVFYYYHSDHLGSSSIMSDRDGKMVQHYGYTAFGYEQYKHNSDAFSVTNRYTGQQLDEDTGLYFYQSRYYDPQLARFTQADTIVPSANTSQALNRYTYVRNNPLKFTDPSGHNVAAAYYNQYLFSGSFPQGWQPKLNLNAVINFSYIFASLAMVVAGGFAVVGFGIGAAVTAGTVAFGGGSGIYSTLNTKFLDMQRQYAMISGMVSNAIASAVYSIKSFGLIGSTKMGSDSYVITNFGSSGFTVSGIDKFYQQPYPDPTGNWSWNAPLPADPDNFSWDAYGQIVPNPDPWDLSWVADFASAIEPDSGFVERWRLSMKRQWKPPGREWFSVFALPPSPVGSVASGLTVGAHYGEKALWSAYRKSFTSFSASRSFAYIHYAKPWAMTGAKFIKVGGIVLMIPTGFYSGHDIGRAAVATVSAWKDKP